MYTKEMEIQIYLKKIEMFLHSVCIQRQIILQKKSTSDLDVELEDNLEDQNYIKIFKT